MFRLFSIKAGRLLLSAVVSIWMAGGCLFGCSSSTAVGAEPEHEAQTVVAGESCHSAHSHDCCAQKPKQQSVKKKIASNRRQPTGVPSFAPGPRGMMKDCPLVMNATAVVSKNSGHVPDAARAPASASALVEKKIEHSNTSLVVPYVANRGPTQLRCCVFLI